MKKINDKQSTCFHLSWRRRILSRGMFSVHLEDGADCCHMNGEYLYARSFISRLKEQGCPSQLFRSFLFVCSFQAGINSSVSSDNSSFR